MNALKIEVELPRDLMAALNIPESELGHRAKEWIVLELFQEGEISAGKAAEILGLSKVRFLDLLAQRKLPYLDGAPGELERDVAAATAALKIHCGSRPPALRIPRKDLVRKKGLTRL